MEKIQEVLNNPIVRNAVISGLSLMVLFVLRHLALKAIMRKGMPAEVRRRLVVNSRNAVFLSVALIFVFIWAEEIRTLALSAFAIAAAIVLATKELILCLSGSLYRASSRAFTVGDRIEIGVFRGDVIDQTPMATTILEIGPGQTSHQHTGRTVVIPNSMLLTAGVINETFTDDFVLHVFSVPVKTEDDWQQAEKHLLEAAQMECSSYLEDARQHFQKMQTRYSLVEVTQVDPRVYIRQAEPGRIDLLVRVAVPARRKGRIEQAVLRRYYEIRKTEDVNSSGTEQDT